MQWLNFVNLFVLFFLIHCYLVIWLKLLFRPLIQPRFRSRPIFSSDQTLQIQVTSDQTFQTQRVSDQSFQTAGVLIRPSVEQGPYTNSDHCPYHMVRPDYDQTQVISKRLWSDPVAIEAFKVRPKCVYNQLWSNWSALETISGQAQVRWK